MGRPPKNPDFERVREAENMTVGEYGEGNGIEKVSESNFVTAAELEKFMNEKVLILVSHMHDDSDLEFIPLGVNGINQPIKRGVPQLVKRKYVEALARSRKTTLRQVQTDPFNPASLEYQPVTMVSYPFTVIRDNNPKGAAWLQSLRDQPEV